MAKRPIFDAPIPGEHYTSDTRNYPWHRPADIPDYDGTVDYVIGRMQDEVTAEIVYSLMKMDRPLTNIVSGLLLQGIARGKFQIDVAVLAAGPIYRYLKMLADKEGIKYNDGFSEKRQPITATTLKMALGIIDDPEPEEEIAPESAGEARTEPSMGLMGRPSQEDTMTASDAEQAAMLGDVDIEEVEEDVTA